MGTTKGTVKLWFDYLQMAILAGIEIDENFYKAWGTWEELIGLSFNKWWLTRGRELFAEDRSTAANVKLVGKTHSAVTVTIPLGVPLDDIKVAVSRIVLDSRPRRRIGQRGKYAVTGQVNYKTLAQYKRFLEVDFYWGDESTTIAEKAEELVRRYEQIHAKGLKQRATLRKSGRASLANRFSTREPEQLIKKESGGISPKLVSRWRLSGKHILLNVAQGRFPGEGYYGPRLKERLVARLQPLGLTDIGEVSRKGGRQRGGTVRRSKTVPEW